MDGLLLGVGGPHDGFDISADVKVAFELHTQRIAGGDEVFQDDVDYMLVKDFHVAERIDIELQTLQLNTTLVRDVFDPNRGEVGEIRERADRRELRDLEIDLDFAPWKFVREGVERKEIHFRSRR